MMVGGIVNVECLLAFELISGLCDCCIVEGVVVLIWFKLVKSIDSGQKLYAWL